MPNGFPASGSRRQAGYSGWMPAIFAAWAQVRDCVSSVFCNSSGLFASTEKPARVLASLTSGLFIAADEYR